MSINLVNKSTQLDTAVYSPINENPPGLVFERSISLLTPKLNSLISLTSECIST